MATLHLVGAGPGDPELITLKAIKVLQKADVVLYDALVNESLLEYAKDAKVIEFVGKRRGHHSMTQVEINARIVKWGSCFTNVVRLKGGDPFVFGRGWEEIIHAEAHGIHTELIPGISSAISVPGMADIPVTHRGLSRSFHVYSATTKDRKLNPEILESIKVSGTKVILMGLNKISEIVKCYTSAGLGDLHVSVIQDGSLPSQKSISGTIQNIESKLKKVPLKAPAIIVIGAVVALKKEKNGTQELSLSYIS